MDKSHREALRMADNAGIEKARIVPLGRHLSLVGEYAGQPCSFLLSNRSAASRPKLLRDELRRFVRNFNKGTQHEASPN